MTNQNSPSQNSDFQIPFNLTMGIFLISVLGLFLEMLLIRWISTEIRIFAYLQNTVLVVCFLGLGLGCFTSKDPIIIRSLLLPLFSIVLLLAIPFTRWALANISLLLSTSEDFIIWSQGVAESPWHTILYMFLGLTLTFLLMCFIMDIFIPIGRILGRLLDSHPKPIWAYSVNILGSLVGIWIFVMLSIIYQPPLTWLLLTGILIIFFLNRRSSSWKLNIGILIGIIALSWIAGKETGSLVTVWSPYQKLVLREVPAPDRDKIGLIGSYTIDVNNTDYQEMIDLSELATRSNPKRYDPERIGLSQYDIPLLMHPNPKKILIVGAGSGNDAAGGIRHNAKNITAVEIDPAIIDLGRRYHPERPYHNGSVNVIIDDARSYFASSQEKYDLIIFGLLDSHTTTAMTNARLDHYVYTRESIIRAKSLLKSDGVMVLNFYATRPFIADRMAGVLREIFGLEPIAFRIPVTQYGRGGLMFVTGDMSIINQQIANNQRLQIQIEKWQKKYPVKLTYNTKIATDDWPYIYLESPKIPLLYYLLAGLIVLLVIRSQKNINIGSLIKNWKTPHWHFFFLGAGFLLLEVQNISKASVVLGNTWDVNAVIISGVLSMILLANLSAVIFPNINLRIVYVLLIGTCLGLYFIDLATFASLRYYQKAIIIGSLTTFPMLFSAIIFMVHPGLAWVQI